PPTSWSERAAERRARRSRRRADPRRARRRGAHRRHGRLRPLAPSPPEGRYAPRPMTRDDVSTYSTSPDRRDRPSAPTTPTGQMRRRLLAIERLIAAVVVVMLIVR